MEAGAAQCCLISEQMGPHMCWEGRNTWPLIWQLPCRCYLGLHGLLLVNVGRAKPTDWKRNHRRMWFVECVSLHIPALQWWLPLGHALAKATRNHQLLPLTDCRGDGWDEGDSRVFGFPTATVYFGCLPPLRCFPWPPAAVPKGHECLVDPVSCPLGQQHYHFKYPGHLRWHLCLRLNPAADRKMMVSSVQGRQYHTE